MGWVTPAPDVDDIRRPSVARSRPPARPPCSRTPAAVSSTARPPCSRTPARRVLERPPAVSSNTRPPCPRTSVRRALASPSQVSFVVVFAPQVPPEQWQSESPYVFICANPQRLPLPLPVSGQHKICTAEQRGKADGSRVGGLADCARVCANVADRQGRWTARCTGAPRTRCAWQRSLRPHANKLPDVYKNRCTNCVAVERSLQGKRGFPSL